MRSLTCLSVLLLTVSPLVYGDPPLVIVSQDGTGDFTEIQTAIDAVDPGGEVVVADGVYVGPGNRDLDFRGKPITVRSLHGPENCIIDCQGSEEDPHRGFYFHSGEGEESILEGLTITNGYIAGNGWPEASGGAIFCQEPRSSPTIRHNKIIGNHAYYGGGICCFGSPTITYNLIADNTAEEGGGINCYEWGTIAFNTITRNRAALGGGISVWEDYAPEIINNVISENFAEESGGGISVSDTDPVILGNLVVRNSTDGAGGGLRLSSVPLLNVYNTIVMNTGSSGGGVSGASNFVNCIVWGNWPLDESPEATYSCVDGLTKDDSNISVAPLFVDAANDDWRLSPDSPCIDVGNPATHVAPVIDLDGNERPCGEGVDMGAYEYCGDLPVDTPYRRGDANADGAIDLSDAVFILSFLFTGGAEPLCEKSVDSDDNGTLEITDAVRLLNHLFLDGPPVEDPFADCGTDPTVDDLTCSRFPPCSENP